MYSNVWMSDVFGNHEKDAARVIRTYREINPDSTVTQKHIVMRSDTYKRTVLKPGTIPEKYLDYLLQLHGSTYEDNFTDRSS